MRTSVNISFFVSAEPAASTASKKDYRSTAYNNYSADLVDLDNEVYSTTPPLQPSHNTVTHPITTQTLTKK